jgi:hypothetical protein
MLRAALAAFAAVFTLALAAGAAAAPMGFKDSSMVMGDFSSHWRELWANRAFTARDAVGIGATAMREEEGPRTREMLEGTYTRLLRRWNMEHAQANAWFIGGLGAVRGNDFDDTRTLVAPGMQLDYETTRLYFAALARLYRARGLNHDFGAARAGFSLYEVEYEQTQPWLVLEARHMRGLSKGLELTPMLRLISRRWFLEAGVNMEGRPRFNFMYIF